MQKRQSNIEGLEELKLGELGLSKELILYTIAYNIQLLDEVKNQEKVLFTSQAENLMMKFAMALGKLMMVEDYIRDIENKKKEFPNTVYIETNKQTNMNKIVSKAQVHEQTTYILEMWHKIMKECNEQCKINVENILYTAHDMLNVKREQLNNKTTYKHKEEDKKDDVTLSIWAGLFTKIPLKITDTNVMSAVVPIWVSNNDVKNNENNSLRYLNNVLKHCFDYIIIINPLCLIKDESVFANIASINPNLMKICNEYRNIASKIIEISNSELKNNYEDIEKYLEKLKNNYMIDEN